MLYRLFHSWRNSYSGIPPRIWFLSLVNLVNRVGGMAISFITLYLTQKLGFSIEDAGYVMGCYGVGALAGAWLGGRLTDNWGYYWVQVYSLMLNGVLLIALLLAQDFWAMCIMVFIMAVTSEVFRPANSVAIAQNCSPETRTRSVSLYRMSANLGWALAPALGGLVIGLGWHWLFWIDGFTCILAALLLRLKMEPPVFERPLAISSEAVIDADYDAFRSPLKDKFFLWFVGLTMLGAVAFMQLLWTVPVFFKQEYQWSESSIGLMIALNGVLVFIIEMPLIYRIEGRRSVLAFIRWGLAAYTIAYAIFLAPGLGFFVAALIYMLFISLGEIFVMPFSSNFVMGRSSQNKQGAYMSLYVMAYSIANIISPLLGTQVIAHFGFGFLWKLMAALSLITLIGILILEKQVQKVDVLEMK
jgi:predicted MFS family arabinose efflux permease